MRHASYLRQATCWVLLAFGIAWPISATQVGVRYEEGLSRGFLVLKTLEGKKIADGQSFQSVKDGKVTGRLIFRFNDGSLYDDTTVFTQNGTFRLLSDHVIEKGPSFKSPSDTLVDAEHGEVSIRYSEKGKTKSITRKMQLPPDISNGILLTLVKDLKPTESVSLPYMAFTPKPRMVKIWMRTEGPSKFHVDDSPREATHWALTFEIGGITGAVAKLMGKKLPTIQMWVLGKDAPTVAGSEGPLYANGPIWDIELVSPVRSTTSR